LIPVAVHTAAFPPHISDAGTGREVWLRLLRTRVHYQSINWQLIDNNIQTAADITAEELCAGLQAAGAGETDQTTNYQDH